MTDLTGKTALVTGGTGGIYYTYNEPFRSPNMELGG